MATQESILVFPAGMPSGLAFAHKAIHSGRRVVGASSLAHDPERERYPEWTSLPWVVEQNFRDQLAERIRLFTINEIFTSHPVVWDKINQLLPSLPAGVRLHAQEWDNDLASYDRQHTLAEEFLQRSDQWNWSCKSRSPLTTTQTAGLIRLFELTPGQCSHTKLEALMGVYRDLPAGDAVEIGCLFGRTALVLAFLAQSYRTGHLLCVDPWSPDELLQNTEDVDARSERVPIQKIFEAFCANLAPWSDITNYLRQTSVVAARSYAGSKTVASAEFGVTEYSGGITILHIDGNHARHAVADDLRSWVHFVVPGGWIIFDDYRWLFGDGPRLVADEFCQIFKEHWSLAYEVGGALFVRLDSRIDRIKLSNQSFLSSLSC